MNGHRGCDGGTFLLESHHRGERVAGARTLLYASQVGAYSHFYVTHRVCMQRFLKSAHSLEQMFSKLL